MLTQDIKRYEVKKHGKKILLTPREFRLAQLFLEKKGFPVTREEALNTVWGIEKGMEIDTRTVDQHVARLRAKVGFDFLETVYTVGWRCISGKLVK
jgi:DNA-binding response OmpR family regulator